MRRFAVFGHPVAHSLSPLMHQANFRALGMAATYETRDINSAFAFRTALGEFRSGGVNCTIPLKRIAFENCDNHDATATRFGVVNTVFFEDNGTTTGYNTDGIGFLQSLAEDLKCSPDGKSVFIFGCGGAGRAVAIACADAGARRIVLANRSPERMITLAEELTVLATATEVGTTPASPGAWSEACRQCDLVVQCSSAGMRQGDPSPLAQSAFHHKQKLYDLIYTSANTPAMLSAQSAGAQTANGLGMLVHQGAASFTIWTGRKADIKTMRTALADRLAL